MSDFRSEIWPEEPAPDNLKDCCEYGLFKQITAKNHPLLFAWET